MQDICLLAMSLAMFGQNRFLSLLSLIDVVPWCAACSVSSVLLLSSSGTTTLFPRVLGEWLDSVCTNGEASPGHSLAPELELLRVLDDAIVIPVL
jgi:hypothetical protein